MKVPGRPWVLLEHSAGASNPPFLSHLSGKERADPPTAITSGARRAEISEASPSKAIAAARETKKRERAERQATGRGQEEKRRGLREAGGTDQKEGTAPRVR